MQFHKETQNRTLYFDAWLRVQPRDWPVRPYVEGFAGARLAMVHYSLSGAESNVDSSVWSDAQEWSSSLGWGAGVDFAGLLQIADTVSFTLGARRLHGKHVSFTLEGSVSGDQVSTEHDVAGSVTLFMLGIVAWFDLGKPS
jgi:opacity protein-like surface antigen